MKTIPFPSADNRPNPKAKKRSQVDSLHPRETAHELMNQLTVIGLCVHKLRGTLLGTTTESQIKDLDSVEHAVEQMVQLTERLAAQLSERPSHVETVKAQTSTKSLFARGKLYPILSRLELDR